MSFLEKLQEINTFVFDVDGVFTDGSVLLQEDSSLLRIMNTRDGLAVKQAITQGYHIFIITGGKSKGLLARLVNLGIPQENIFMDAQEKLRVFHELVKTKK